jgi:divalent metal cation (Fe/Co/Zn/Cd) transporter
MQRRYRITLTNCNESTALHTIYDWLTVAVFAGLIVLFLQRSMQDAPSDKLWHYLVASAGCAVTNFLGNQGVELGSTVYHLGAVATLVATGAFVVYFIRPFPV